MSHHRAIGLITTFISGRFYEQIMSGVQKVARQNQVDILVIHGTPENVALTQIGEQRVDGWLVLTYTQGMDLLAKQGKPIVTISCRVPGQVFPAVFPENRQGTESIMEHLLKQGHKRIAFVGDTSIGDIQERYITYQDFLKRNDIPFDPGLVVITESPLPDQGANAARRLMASRLAYSAVVAGNDWTAIGLMREFQEHGYRLPDDIAIVGFDDIPEAQITNPPLSTVRQHSDKLGEKAATSLMALIAGEAATASVDYIPTTFVERESSGCNLLTRISEWEKPKIEADTLWQVALAKELVDELLPTLQHESDPSPAQVWPEVDKLVQLLAVTINGRELKEIDRGLLQAIFSSEPMLNASPEVLVKMLDIIEAAGLELIKNHPEHDLAAHRIQALRDQLFIEIMRSYRRRQNSSQRTLSEILQSQYNISQLLIQCPPQQVDWIKETSMYSGCLGLWSPSWGDKPPIMSVAGCYKREGAISLRVGTAFSAPQFPPVDLLPSSGQKKGITTCLVLPVRSADHDWGMLAVSGPLISNDPWLEDNTINTFEICCGFLGLALEREVLQEALRHASDTEQQLTERVQELTSQLPEV